MEEDSQWFSIGRHDNQLSDTTVQCFSSFVRTWGGRKEEETDGKNGWKKNNNYCNNNKKKKKKKKKKT